MKLNKFYGIVFMLLLTSVTFAQQLPQFTQYMFNTISINPAYAGSRETLSYIETYIKRMLVLLQLE